MITTPPLLAPAVSVVMPMYNAEKYIGACLESILNQTLQDFEVIVVDDCSTDNSVAVVESYVPRFGGRLKISRTQKNSGGPSCARNKGANLSRGKYLYFMDNDDLLVNVALETFYNAAENFGAEVVNAGKVIEFATEEPFPAPGSTVVRNWQREVPAEPTFASEDLAERVKEFVNGGIAYQAWTKLVRRDFLMENEIIFPIVTASEDAMWSLQVFFLAKKFLHIPQPLYLYRHRASSISHFNREQGKVNFWNEGVLDCVEFLSEFLSQQKFFQEKPQYKFALFEQLDKGHFDQSVRGLLKMPIPEVYSALKIQLAEKFGGQADLIAYLCASSNLSRLRLLMASQRIAELENQLKQIQGS